VPALWGDVAERVADEKAGRVTLAQLLARRDELLTKCADVDRDAAVAREAGLPLNARECAGFDYHVQLRLVERSLFRFYESQQGKKFGR
jgi:hypothetical protein